MSYLELMVERLSAYGFLKTKEVKEAMLAVDRRIFFPKSSTNLAYDDIAYPVGYGQTISAPTVVAFMLEQLFLGKGMKVLEIGTGTGYNTALLAHIVGKKGKVITFDVIPELVELARQNIMNCEKDKLCNEPLLDHIELLSGDGSCGYEDDAPYDRIIVTAAMPHLDDSHPMVKQLEPDGKMIAPVGGLYFQDLIVVEKKTNSFKSVLPVMFVPLKGKCGFK